jgi:hypothetical protein
MDADADKRKEGMQALAGIAAYEALALLVVVAVYLSTREFAWLAAGIIGVQLIFIPMFIRWGKEHGAAFKARDARGRQRDAG